MKVRIAKMNVESVNNIDRAEMAHHLGLLAESVETIQSELDTCSEEVSVPYAVLGAIGKSGLIMLHLLRPDLTTDDGFPAAILDEYTSVEADKVIEDAQCMFAAVTSVVRDAEEEMGILTKLMPASVKSHAAAELVTAWTSVYEQYLNNDVSGVTVH